MEEMDGRAASLAAAEALGDYRELDREFALLAAATADQVGTVAERYLDPQSVSAVVYQPRDRGADLSADGLARAFAVTRLSSPPVPVPPPSPPPPAKPGPASTRALVAQVYHEAAPAFDLLVRRKSGVPAVTLGVYLPRSQFEPPGQSGMTALAVRSAIRGAGGLDAAGLAFAFERLGGTVSPTVTLDWVGYGVTVLSSNLLAAATLLDQVLHQPALTEASIAAERQILFEETSQVADDMYRFPFQLAFAAAYGERSYGIPAHGLPADVAVLETQTTRDWYRSTMLRPRGLVVAVGDLEPDEALPLLNQVFGRHEARSAAPLVRPVEWSVTEGAAPRLVERDKAQSAFAFALPGPSRREPDRHAAEVWAAVASGLGGRLFEALRDKRSLAYTVVASSWQKARGGSFLTYIATSPEREAEARQEMLKELERFALEPVSADELSRAINYLAGQTEVSRQSAGAVAGEILDAWLAGAGLGDLTDPASHYRAVTAEQVREVAQRAMRGPWAEGVVRGRGGGR
jgi:zinc protease